MAAILASAGSQIPNIFGGFAPFPNTIATALLAYQSEAIGFGFGIKFQYSKRLIGAMTNEEFNALTPITIGQIVESHNTELINRMKLEMPKWLDIQKDFIEASVAIEIAKANRTPSAWAEIITAFSQGASQQIADSLNSLDPASLALILASNPILSLIYTLAGGGPGPVPIEDDDPLPDEKPPLGEHIEGDIHTEEEHQAEDDLAAIKADQALFKIIVITWLDPARGITQRLTTGEFTHAQHHTFKSTLQSMIENGTNEILTDTGSTIGGGTNIIFAYQKKINSSYLHL